MYVCSVPTCLSKDTIMHRFPNPKTNLKRFDKWLSFVGRDDFSRKDKMAIYNNYRICDLHFGDDQKFGGIHNSSNLKKSAVPALKFAKLLIGNVTQSQHIVKKQFANQEVIPIIVAPEFGQPPRKKYRKVYDVESITGPSSSVDHLPEVETLPSQVPGTSPELYTVLRTSTDVFTPEQANTVKVKDTMAPKYKLTYFSAMALAEPIRWLLSYGNLQFEDIRVSPDDWKIMKQNIKFGILPILEVDGREMYQSVAICRYVGKLVGLNGSNDWENYKIDMIADFVSDLRETYNKLPNSSANRPSIKESLLQETIPYHLSRFEKMAEDSGYLANKKLTWADIYFAAMLDYNNGVMDVDIIQEDLYPTLDRIRNEVRAIPEIAAWIYRRPWSEY